MTIRNLHRICALPIAVFVLVHLANHLVSLVGVSAHIAFMEAARRVYRQPAIEAVLLLAVAFQISSGMSFVIRRWGQQRGVVAWLQMGSGVYLAFFLCVHVGAVLYGRYALNLDTNFYFAAAGFHVPPFHYLFVPYYFLAVLALFTHLGCVAYWRLDPASRPARMLAVVLPGLVGGAVALLVCMSFAGMIQTVQVPAKYKAIYDAKTLVERQESISTDGTSVEPERRVGDNQP